MSSFSLGLVGLPNVGKSTLFNALTRAGAAVANYPFCTIEPNVGVVPIPDERLQAVAGVLRPETLTPATIRFVDIAGLVQGAHRGEGLGNQFLAHIREVDAVVHVVRFFSDPDVAHAQDALDPVRDASVVEAELILADLETVERRLEKTVRAAKGGDPRYRRELAALERLRDALQRGRPARGQDEETAALAGELFLLTAKPVLYAANLAEADLAAVMAGERPPGYAELLAVAAGRDAEVVPVSAAFEADLAEIAPEEAAVFRSEAGLAESSLVRLVQAGCRLLDLITFYTVKGPETRAWLIPRGTRAPQAAGKIHTDMERGFIRAEVLAWSELIDMGSFARAREQGLVRSEGREYQVQDGDVVLFRFNV